MSRSRPGTVVPRSARSTRRGCRASAPDWCMSAAIPRRRRPSCIAACTAGARRPGPWCISTRPIRSPSACWRTPIRMTCCRRPPRTMHARRQLVPYHTPGDMALARAVEKLAEDNHALLLTNHGPVAAGATQRGTVRDRGAGGNCEAVPAPARRNAAASDAGAGESPQEPIGVPVGRTAARPPEARRGIQPRSGAAPGSCRRPIRSRRAWSRH